MWQDDDFNQLDYDLRAATKRGDLPPDIIRLLSRAYGELIANESTILRLESQYGVQYDRAEKMMKERDEANANAKLYRDDRDEARRNLCLTEAAILSFGPDGVPYHPSVAHKIAAEYGWDCFHNSNNQENDNGEE